MPYRANIRFAFTPASLVLCIAEDQERLLTDLRPERNQKSHKNSLKSNIGQLVSVCKFMEHINVTVLSDNL